MKKPVIKFGVADIVAVIVFVILNWVFFHYFPISVCIVWLLLCCLASFAPSPSSFPLSSPADSASTEPLPSPVNIASTEPLPFPVNSASTEPLPSSVRSASTKPLPFPVNSASTETLPSPVRSAPTKPLPFPVNSSSNPLPSPTNSASTESQPSLELMSSPADSSSTESLPSPANSSSTKLLPAPADSDSTEPLPSPADSASTEPLPPSADSTSASAGRALSLVLSAVSSSPFVSCKYNLVRSLADQILNRNLASGVEELLELNRAALAVAFARTIALLEVAIETEVCLASGLLQSWAAQARERGASAEKLAAETMWLGQKMAESRAASKAVTMWGSMVRLPVLAISVKSSLRNLIVRVGEFMFTLIYSEELEGNSTSSRLALLKAWLPLLCQFGKKEDTVRLLERMIEKFTHEEQEDIISLAMLKAWLPLLCQLGMKADMVRLLERMIEKFTHEEQGDILSLWLRHYTSCSDFNCLNLENSYMRWYSESEKLNLK